MSNTPLHHQTTRHTWGIPAWWFGAPVIAFAYALVTPRLLPDVVAIPEPTSALAGPIRWLVGLVLGVTLLSLWQLGGWVHAKRRDKRWPTRISG